MLGLHYFIVFARAPTTRVNIYLVHLIEFGVSVDIEYYYGHFLDDSTTRDLLFYP